MVMAMARGPRTRTGGTRRVVALVAGVLVAGVALAGATQLRGVHADRTEGFPPGQASSLSVSVATP
jgi:hypothetical protein